MNCTSCTSQIPDHARFCPVCGRSTTGNGAEQATRTQVVGGSGWATTAARSRTSRRTPSGALSAGAGGLASSMELAAARFLPGVMVAERYRIVGLLGRGGMGEVYRADDLKLGQAVALKFLPQGFEDVPGRVERFLDEVRVARQINHANVCRVHDVGEVEGQHFLTMEYVDGEDLASLLRRIGRLPHDKAVQIARQLCAGLAAAHERDILHRDLKPSNVMIDGRGQVRITDFGLAGVAESFSGAEILAGTPDYMAPEQLTGTEVSVKSDIYALGHLLYELFTGARAFRADTLAELTRLQREASPSRPSTLVDEIDPLVERVILRCLEKDPAERPASALAVAAALPGGDPLAAALAAGETPSPEMVAAAGPQGGLRPGRALFLLAAIACGVTLLGLGAADMHLYGKVPMTKSRDALEENARSILTKLGYEETAKDRESYFRHRGEPLIAMAQRDASPERWAPLDDPGQRVLYLFSRRGDDYFSPSNIAGAVTDTDPAPEPGDVQLGVDLSGRLISLRAISKAYDHGGEPRPPTDWAALFQVAGLDLAAFEASEPRMRPALWSDERVAYSGTLPSGESVRIEAAAVAGRPVFFEIVDSRHPAWSAEAAAAREERDVAAGARSANAFVLVLVLLIAAGAVYLAFRNSRLGRSDFRGGLVLAGFVLVMRLGDWLLGGHHVPEFTSEFSMLIGVLGGALVLSALTLVFYLTIEPYIRKLRPQGLVSWTRLLKGRWRDPLVGRDALIGASFGVALHVLFLGSSQLQAWLGMPPSMPITLAHQALAGGRWAIAQLFEVTLRGLASALGITVLFLLLRILLRRTWIAATALGLVFVILGVMESLLVEGSSFGPMALGILFNAIQGGILAALVVRYGLLATVATFVVSNTFVFYPITFDPARPYFATSLFALIFVALLAASAFRIALAGRPLFGDAILSAKHAS